MFEICGTTPLFSKCNILPYNSVAFDGCHYYLTAKCKKKIYRMNECFQSMESFSTCRIYTSICYDSCEKWFWAISGESDSKLFKLNCSFKEIDQICINQNRGAFTGIDYMSKGDAILLSTSDKILKIEKSVPLSITVIKECANICITGVTGLSSSYLYYYIFLYYCLYLMFSYFVSFFYFNL